MKIVNKELLREFSAKRRCEYCKSPVDGCDPHHIHSKGAGRVDIAENIAALCRSCHASAHANGSPSRDELLAIAAKREGTTPDAIVNKVYRIRRDKSCKVKVIG